MPLTVTMQESGGFDLHDEGEWFDGTLVDIQELTDGQFGPGLKWIINLDGDVDSISGEPRDTWAFSSQKLSPRSKLYKWVKGILGDAGLPDLGGTLDLGKIIGSRVKVMFEQGPGLDRDGNAVVKEKVVGMKSSTTATPPTAEPEPVVAAEAAPIQTTAEPF